MKRYALLLIAAILLTACASDPLGIAESSRQRWQAQTDIARSDTDARSAEAQANVAIAQAQANAAVAIEQTRSDLAQSQATKDYALATQSQALLREARSDAVIVLLAFALVAVVGVVVVYIVMRERRPVQPLYIAGTPPRRSLPPPSAWPVDEDAVLDVLLIEDKQR